MAKAGFRAVVAGSFAEIFFGNATGVGLPCVSLEPDDLRELTAAVLADPTLEVNVDVEALRVSAGGRSYAARMPETARSVLVAGTYDPLSELLQGLDQTLLVAARLGHGARE